MIAALAWLPILEPMPGIDRAWMLTLPIIALLTAAGYKAVQMSSFEGYSRAVLAMTVQIVGLLLAAMAVVALLSLLI